LFKISSRIQLNEKEKFLKKHCDKTTGNKIL